MRSQEIRRVAPEMDPLRMGMGWTPQDLDKPQILVESTFGDSHPGSAHLLGLVEQAVSGIDEAGERAPDILPRIFVMDKPRGTMGSTIPWPPAI